MPENKFLISQTPDARDLPLPGYMTPHTAGMDIYANVHETVVLQKGEIKAIPAGIKIDLPPEFEAQIRPRSGLALKYGITMINAVGTVDADFRGELMVLLVNHGQADFPINRGDRIGQMVINKIERIAWTVTENLTETARGEGGFGHTGV
ncbi:MAG: dUTP diphosphatase [Clostridiales bacterium]|jgi:dUTP pyrophosphatase|nr:dUTP diphosphatase [Clostridiales bacterium]